MHEAGLLAAAIADALAVPGPDEAGGSGLPGARRPVAVEVRVHDPIHVGVESARLHAELAMRARGLGDGPVEVSADPVACPMCDVINEVDSSHPFCEACGWPLPDRGGHQVEALVRWSVR
jgi:hypothetical protein